MLFWCFANIWIYDLKHACKHCKLKVHSWHTLFISKMYNKLEQWMQGSKFFRTFSSSYFCNKRCAWPMGWCHVLISAQPNGKRFNAVEQQPQAICSIKQQCKVLWSAESSKPHKKQVTLLMLTITFLCLWIHHQMERVLLVQHNEMKLPVMHLCKTCWMEVNVYCCGFFINPTDFMKNKKSALLNTYWPSVWSTFTMKQTASQIESKLAHAMLHKWPGSQERKHSPVNKWNINNCCCLEATKKSTGSPWPKHIWESATFMSCMIEIPAVLLTLVHSNKVPNSDQTQSTRCPTVDLPLFSWRKNHNSRNISDWSQISICNWKPIASYNSDKWEDGNSCFIHNMQCCRID